MASTRPNSSQPGSWRKIWAITWISAATPHEEEEILAPLDLIHRYEEQRASLNAEIDRVLAEITAKLGGNAE